MDEGEDGRGIEENVTVLGLLLLPTNRGELFVLRERLLAEEEEEEVEGGAVIGLPLLLLLIVLLLFILFLALEAGIKEDNLLDRLGRILL